MLISFKKAAPQSGEKSRTLFSVFLYLTACLFFVSAMEGRGDKGPAPPQLLQPSPEAQWAIVLHNGQEEILILTTEVRADKPAEALGFLPFPSEPYVQSAPGASFVEIENILGEKRIELISSEVDKDKEASTAPLAIALSERVDVRDITVIKVDDIFGFKGWVEGWVGRRGAEDSGDLGPLCKIAEDYLSRKFSYFVFHSVSVQAEKRSMGPLVYRFKTDKLYYPLKTWNAGAGQGSVNLILIAPGSLSGGQTRIPYNLSTYFYSPDFELTASPRVAFECSNSARLRPEEVEKVHPQAREFFAGTKGLHLQVMRYIGPSDFPSDLFLEISKLEPRTFVWDRAPEESPLEGALLLRPVAGTGV